MLLNDTTPINHTMTGEIPCPGSYDDLNNDIQNLHPGDTYDVNKNYYFDKTNIAYHDRVIEINTDNVTINGNGHIIDAGSVSKSFSIFKVTGNNVKISNLTFIYSQPNGDIVVSDDKPSYYKFVESPVSWYGDNGVLSNCNFHDNTAVNGGALSWSGNNGLIENCQFINNTAQGIGGAIYISGENNTINRSIFINCHSELSGEAIYFDRNRKNIVFNNLTTTKNTTLFIDGKLVDIDVNYLYYTYLMNVGGECYYKGFMIDIIPEIYKCLIYGSATDKYHTYYANYNNTTGEFTLNLYTNYGNFNNNLKGLEYINKLHFNITCFNDIYTKLFNHNYKEFSSEIATIFVNNDEDYWSIFTKEMHIPTLRALCENHTRTLNVILAKNIFIHSKYCFNVKELGYDTINVEGSGSTIQAVTGPRDEFKWAITAPGYTFSASNIQVEGFNLAIENKGTCILNNVKLHNNRMDYWIERDWGAAMLNTGYAICNHCSFTNNYAKNGGAIFNQGVLNLNNCTFSNNEAYGDGNDVCVGKDGKVQINGVNITESCGPVHFTHSLSITDISLLTVLCIGSTIILSILAGAATGGALAAAGAGLIIGAFHGFIAAEMVSRNVFDVNFDTTAYCAIMMGVCITCGIAGGIIGFSFFSGVTCCDLWCSSSESSVYYVMDYSSSSSSSVLSDSSSVLSGIIV